MQKEITLIPCHCKRCGTELLTTSQSIYGIDKLKEEFGIVCSSCNTEEETASLLHEMGKAIQKKVIEQSHNI